MSTPSTEKHDVGLKDLPAPKKSSLIKRILLTLVLGLLAAMGVFAIVVAIQPNEYSITRSATMSAPPAEVFAQVNDFHNWQHWSPWEKLDPNAKYSFAGPDSGEGAIFRWAGNDDVGEGSMTITDSNPPKRIRLTLAFIKPMQDTADTEFLFQPVGEGTTVTWTMSGKKQGFVQKAFCLVMNMDKMLGGQFDEGLANLKDVVEKAN
jgi:hypothetical protein